MLAINAAACISGLCLLWLFSAQFVSNYVAYESAGASCMYLISRYIVSWPNYLHENRILASRAAYHAAGFLPSAFSLLGVFKTITVGQIDGLMYVSSVVFGAELGEYRKMCLRNRK
ncbi:hypothetical protein [Burkholderia guangdongensis]|uniref:hypothetical protein n=1 Tax=Burkholderia guangdongensis TaxID=1792500 RepID=UPI0015C7C7D3|nr:hypothetical protein [Burkholderia guangdongensis]